MCGNILTTASSSFPETNEIYYIRARCEEVLPSSNYLLAAKDTKIFLSRYQTDTTFRYGDSLSFCTYLRPLRENANIGEFSYSRYLKQKGVSCQAFPQTPIRICGKTRNMYTFFDRSRQRLLQKTAVLFPDTLHRSLINALCLGYKNDLQAELKKQFTDTGTIHLLSVSGLHVGAIYLLLSFLLSLTNCPRILCGLLLLPAIWGYTCLTGLSPSTVRASTILTFIAWGKIFERDYTPLNAIAASAFFTLCIQPGLFRSLSFLMSYSAYTGIILLYPVFTRFFRLRHPLVSRIYASCCVTLSAQIPTLPLSAYYFHTININSFLTNLIAVPVATFLLYCSAILLFLPVSWGTAFAFIPHFLCDCLLYLLEFFKKFSINLKELYPDLITICLISLAAFLTGRYLLHHKRLAFRLACFCWGGSIGYLCFQNSQAARQQEIVIFQIPQHTLILLNIHGQIISLANDAPQLEKAMPYLRIHKADSLSAPCSFVGLQWSYIHQTLYCDTTIYRILSPAASRFFNSHTLIVTRNLFPEDYFPSSGSLCLPRQVILDGSNSFATQNAWELFCISHQISFQTTTNQGSIRISLK